MNLPQKITTRISELGNSLDFQKIKVFQKTIKIPKERLLTIPNDYLKQKQRELYRLLQYSAIPKFVFSQKGFFFADKAKFHLGDKYLINTDIKNFFPSIHYGKVQKIFTGFEIQKETVQKLTFITTFDKSLPLGFVTSPILSNLVLLKMDKDLSKYVRLRKIKYSRYVDDMTFSSNKKIEKVFFENILRIVKAHGFVLNKDKTEFFGPSDTKIVLGLKLEEDRVNITSEYLQKVVNHLKLLEAFVKNGLDYQDLRLVVAGELNFVRQINKEIFEDLNKRLAT